MPPDGGGEHDWVQLLVLDAVAGQLWWPVAVKPVTTTVGPEANGPRAVGEQLLCLPISVITVGRVLIA